MVTTDAEHDFWTRDGSTVHQELAKRYEQNIQVTHPRGASCFCGPECPWAATKVEYPTYTGPKVTSLSGGRD